MSDTAVHYYLVSGEPSGDMLAAELMDELRARNPDARFAGVGGDACAARGLDSLFSQSDIALMGLAEILPHLPRLHRRYRQTLADICQRQPQTVITIDAPGFTFPIAKVLRRWRRQGRWQGRLVHYVAPSVWAWKPGRAKKYAAVYDEMLCLLPFEPPYFEQHGLKATFTGHPVARNSRYEQADGALFRHQHGLLPLRPLLCLLPGSRHGEVGRMLPLFLETVRMLRRNNPELAIAILTLPSLRQSVEQQLRGAGLEAIIETDAEKKYNLLAGSTAALAASGTVSLELAAAKLPGVVAYRVHPLTAAIARRLVKTPYVSIANILLDKEVFPEYLQEQASPDNLAQAVGSLLAGGHETFKNHAEKAIALLRTSASAGDAL